MKLTIGKTYIFRYRVGNMKAREQTIGKYKGVVSHSKQQSVRTLEFERVSPQKWQNSKIAISEKLIEKIFELDEEITDK